MLSSYFTVLTCIVAASGPVSAPKDEVVNNKRPANNVKKRQQQRQQSQPYEGLNVRDVNIGRPNDYTELSVDPNPNGMYLELV